MDGRACTHRHADICQASRYKQAGRQAGLRISAAIAGAPQARSNRLLLMRTRAQGKYCLTATALGASVRHRRTLLYRFYRGCENEKSFPSCRSTFCSKPSQNFCISCFGTTCFSGSLWSNVAFLALGPHTFPVHCGLSLLSCLKTTRFFGSLWSNVAFLPWDHMFFQFTVV